ncbi:gag-asp_proteas domain-containing protein [Cucumis melo var. makuwa]|uniref:Gag-asp_proteas domain-containing protein n=1 Tax=Cucumis melo var. makuwa TaxID=1194695 RepID=A0A5D3BCF8_CUCMM|nr:gag-asp_proteas domain-containing protein [Cucumis melo var. makuwa]
MKAINFKALPIMGISKKSSLKLGKWRGDVYLVMIRIDDFNMLLGIEFLLKHKVIPMPLAQCMVVTSGSSTIVNEYVDVISHELPKSQPPRQEINHEIEHVPRA